MILGHLVEVMMALINEHFKKKFKSFGMSRNTSCLLITSTFHWEAVQVRDSFLLFLESCDFEYRMFYTRLVVISSFSVECVL